MAVSVTSSGKAWSTTAISTLTHSMTVSGTDPCLVVNVDQYGDPPSSITSVVWNTSESMTNMATCATVASYCSCAGYIISAPTATTANIVVTWASTPWGRGIQYLLLAGVDQTTANAYENVTKDDNGVDATAEVTITSAADDMVVCGAGSDGNSIAISSGSSAGVTSAQETEQPGEPYSGAISYCAGAASITTGWTASGGGSRKAACWGANIIQASGAPAASGANFLTLLGVG